MEKRIEIRPIGDNCRGIAMFRKKKDALHKVQLASYEDSIALYESAIVNYESAINVYIQSIKEAESILIGALGLSEHPNVPLRILADSVSMKIEDLEEALRNH